MNSSPIIRVSRKRTADPHTALVVNVKRSKNDQLFFSLFKTSDAPTISQDSVSSPVIDFQQQQESMENDNPLSFANDSINEIGGPEPKPSVDDDVIMVNGQPLVSTSAPKSCDDVVYDFYKVALGEVENLDGDYEDWQMRVATKEEARLFLDGELSSDSDFNQDDDDSNDENNWRNDYPEEEDSDEDPDDTESDCEQWNGEYNSDEDGDGLRLRMQRFGLKADEDNSDEEEEEDY